MQLQVIQQVETQLLVFKQQLHAVNGNVITIFVGQGGGGGTGASITATVGAGGTLTFAVAGAGISYTNPQIICS